MRKDVLKGLVIGCFAALVFAVCVPVGVWAGEVTEVAEAEMKFNLYRIKNKTGTIIDWGEDYVCDDKQLYYRDDDNEYISVKEIEQMFGITILLDENSDMRISHDGVHIFIDDAVEQLLDNNIVVEKVGDRIHLIERSIPFTITYRDTVYIPIEAIARMSGLSITYSGTEYDFSSGYSSLHFDITDLVDEDSEIITYGNNPYISIDVVCRLFDITTLWNGDSMTITLLNFDPSGVNGDVILDDSVEMADASGNVWNYSVIRHISTIVGNDGYSSTFVEYYMVITDQARGFSRAYLLENGAHEFAEDRVYLVKLEYPLSWWYRGGYGQRTLNFTTIFYENTPDNQDGDEWVKEFDGHRQIPGSSFIENGIAYYSVSGVSTTFHTTTSGYSLNFETGEFKVEWSVRQ